MMKKEFISITILFIVAQVCLILWTSSEKEQKVNHVLRGDIAVIDKQKVLKELSAVVGIRNVLEEYLKQCQKDFIEKEEALRKEHQDIVGAEATPKDYDQALLIEEKRKAFKASVLAAQRAADALRKKVQDAYEKVMEKIQKHFTEVVQGLAQERQLDCVIDRAQVVYYNITKDLTDVALERLNEATKDIVLEVNSDNNA